jgi:toxin ParE1/3/4
MTRAGVRVSFAIRAKKDLLRIGEYTIHTWGEAQAVRYLGSLEKCAEMLAGNPALGRKCDWICSGLFRFEQVRHVIFYRKKRSGIHIVRILPRSMLPEEHLREGDDSES